jgi:hypothetical protein
MRRVVWRESLEKTLDREFPHGQTAKQSPSQPPEDNELIRPTKRLDSVNGEGK